MSGILSDYLAGMPVKVIAALHGMHENTVFKKLCDLGIPRRRGTPRNARALIGADYAAGLSVKAIAAGRGCSARTVRRAVLELDLPRRHPAAFGKFVGEGAS